MLVPSSVSIKPIKQTKKIDIIVKKELKSQPNFSHYVKKIEFQGKNCFLIKKHLYSDFKDNL